MKDPINSNLSSRLEGFVEIPIHEESVSAASIPKASQDFLPGGKTVTEVLGGASTRFTTIVKNAAANFSNAGFSLIPRSGDSEKPLSNIEEIKHLAKTKPFEDDEEDENFSDVSSHYSDDGNNSGRTSKETDSSGSSSPRTSVQSMNDIKPEERGEWVESPHVRS